MLIPWVVEGNDPSYATYHAIGATHVGRSLRDPRTTRAALVADKAQGFGTCVYSAHSWYPDLSARAWADGINNQLKAVDGGTPDDPIVCIDLETDDLQYVRDTFARWKQHRPKRVTDWTFEGHKGGIFTPNDVAILLQLVSRYFVPQCYNGAMTQVWDTLAMARDLTSVGIPDARIVPFVDGRAIPAWLQGYVFPKDGKP